MARNVVKYRGLPGDTEHSEVVGPADHGAAVCIVTGIGYILDIPLIVHPDHLKIAALFVRLECIWQGDGHIAAEAGDCLPTADDSQVVSRVIAQDCFGSLGQLALVHHYRIDGHVTTGSIIDGFQRLQV